MIFKALQIKKMASEAKENPGKFAGKKVGEMFMGMLFMPSLITLLVLITFFVLGYVHFLGGPYGFFKFIFVISCVAVLCILYVLRKIYVMITSVTKNVVNSTITIESQIIE